MEKINILGIDIDVIDKKQTLLKIEEFLAGGKQNFTVTVNPEIILHAAEDKEFFNILNKADLSLADGVGLKMAGWLMMKNLPRLTGADLAKDILKLAQDKDKRVAVVNWRGGLSGGKEIFAALKNKFSGLNIKVFDFEREEAGNLSELNNFSPEILFCNFGAPYQEKFIYNNLAKMPSVKVGLGVGGAFDFLTGKIKRAPKFMRFLGLEWLWRLFKQPWRLKRIFNAVVVFPFKFLIWRLKKHD